MGKSTAKVATATGQSGHDRSAGLRKHLTLVVAGFLGMGLVAAVSGCTISPPIPAPAPAVTPAYGVFAPTVAWSATFGGTGEDQFWALAVADDGSMIVAGDTDSADGDFSPSQGDCDAVLARVSPAGELEWSLTLGGTKDDSFRSVLLQPDGSIVAVGYSDSVDGDFVRNGGSGGGIAARVTADGHL
ncbi:MAG: hypothetical protein FWF43_08470, partial [Propionibacteriaceae bacterium]|nr:hypothetical protein [Propionibacteriaceae bacterium]